jgi:hypothetical protein
MDKRGVDPDFLLCGIYRKAHSENGARDARQAGAEGEALPDRDGAMPYRAAAVQNILGGTGHSTTLDKIQKAIGG